MRSRDVDEGLKERQASHDVLEINEQELCRIILDIHDGPVQNMYAALSQINLLQGKLMTKNGGGADGKDISRSLTQIAGLLENSLSEIKNFIGTFRPPEFQKRDLIPMFKGLLIQHESLTGSRIKMEVTEPLPTVSVPVKTPSTESCRKRCQTRIVTPARIAMTSGSTRRIMEFVWRSLTRVRALTWLARTINPRLKRDCT